MYEQHFMRKFSTSLARLFLFTILVGCSADLRGVEGPNDQDAALSPDTVLPTGDAGRTALAEGGRDSAERGGTGDGAGGRGGAGTDSSGTGAGGGVGRAGSTGTGDNSHVGGTGRDGGPWSYDANLTADAAQAGDVNVVVDAACDGPGDVATDNVPAAYDSGGADQAIDTADAAAPVRADGASEVPDLGTDRYEVGTKDEGDASCPSNDCVPFVVPSSPSAMKCNMDGSTMELSWTSLSAWEPTHDSRICGSAGAYYIQASIVQFRPGLQVLAEVYAPENSTWYPISGGPVVQPNAAGGFDGSFCLPQKGLDRTFRFRIVQQNTSQDAGVTCLIHVRGQ